ncbi:MAG TPA: exodeoxyribonuclease V subunit alpha [Agitococcus sp.]|nr:exodeoxyribonuclease V subunit alpha [Agitococcus sp.]HMX99334.1 exodeoxyribonuclease V subunit alpha [Agitococcus sp.]HNA20149.1 exodeoxyribonuclease V subunit alpha [Agitococcus sp.]HNB19749.1 exodeoxyribonuclease V subunit alpha [Agitococcus sp.]HNG10679.1 exodeoxyribonuclease V subunit alpha [Agitococcus sp.]
MSFLHLPIQRSEFGSAWADSLATLLVQLHEGQGGNRQHSIRLAGYVRDLCAALDHGHSCLYSEFFDRLADYQSPIIVPVEQALQHIAPLVLEDKRLYLYRYWWDEYRLAQAIKQLNRHIPSTLADADLQQLSVGTHPQQAQAIKVALQSGFTLITGGPGTGKTFTLVRILIALLQQNSQLTVALAAPTGKAAARMQEALRQSLAQLPVAQQLLKALPQTAFTLHRLLGMGHGTQPKFNAQQPLPYDLIIVDEASMIDLRMASQLLTAISPNARLILLGDANQLAAVEAGAVLAELNKAQTLSQSRVHLTQSQRFGGQIGQLAEAVCRGDTLTVTQLIEQSSDELNYAPLEQVESLAKKLFIGYQAFAQALKSKTDIVDLLKLFDDFRVLCAVREGSYGVNALNQRLSLLLQKELVQNEDPLAVWYHGRPVMVTQNDYSLDVFNGDIGITLEEEDGFYVYFPARDTPTKRVSAARLAHSETALALTIHKSQGSEFKQVAVVLPKEESPILTRQLLYTGITRAKKQIQLWALKPILLKTIEQETKRASGLHLKV